GTMIAHSPLHRSGRAVFPHPAPASGNDAKSPQGIGVAHASGRQPSVDDSPHPVPKDSAVLAPTRQGTVPEPADLESEEVERRAVRRHAVVTDVPTDNRPQPLTLLRDGVMHAPLQLEFHLAQFGLQSLADGLPQNREVPIAPLLRADVREAEEVKGIRFALAATTSIPGREGPELDESRLVGVQLQIELSESFRQLHLKLLGFHLALKSQHDVVRKPDDDDVASGLLLPPCLDPDIEHVVQIDVRQERRCAAPGPVRLPVVVRHRRTSLDFPTRPAAPSAVGNHRISRFPRKVFPYVLGVSDRAEPSSVSRCRRHQYCLPTSPTASALRRKLLSRLGTRPARTPVNASTPPLRVAPHDSGPVWVATPSPYDSFIHNTLPV